MENVEILGKEFFLPTKRRGNATSRIKACTNLLDALEKKAISGKKRLVHRGALERLQGQLNFLTETSKSRRSYTKALTKCIAVELGEKRNGDSRGRAVAMAIAQEAPEDQGGGQWTWEQWGLGKLVPLSKEAVADVRQLLQDLMAQPPSAWSARTEVPTEDTIFAFCDSAGENEEDIKSAGAAWIFEHNSAEVNWTRVDWTEEELRQHSTHLETLNGLRTCQAIMRQRPHIKCIVEVYDSQAAVAILRRLSSRDPNLNKLMRERLSLQTQYPELCFMTLWEDRETGFIADLLSKHEDRKARMELAKRFPDRTLASAKWS